jgi:RNA polymerase sigma-70 factor (ECF subfamily)
MDALGSSYLGSLVTEEAAPERGFELRLAESSTLAFRVAYSVLRNRADAEEVAQDALIRAYRSLPSLRDRERLRSWLVRIVWRLALDRQRADRRRERREQAVADPAPGPTVEDQAVRRELRRHLWSAVDRLPRKLREVVVLAAIEGHDIRAAARLLGLPEGTVKSRLFLARKTLVEKLRWIVSGTGRP